MANSDASTLDELKTARDALIDGIATGRTTVTYTLRGRTHTVEKPTEALLNLEKLIDVYETKANRGSTSIFRPVSLSRASARGNS